MNRVERRLKFCNFLGKIPELFGAISNDKLQLIRLLLISNMTILYTCTIVRLTKLNEFFVSGNRLPTINGLINVNGFKIVQQETITNVGFPSFFFCFYCDRNSSIHELNALD